MKKITYTYLEWFQEDAANPSCDDRLIRFESESDRDYWLHVFNDVDGVTHAVAVDEDEVARKYDLEDFYNDNAKEGERCPSGHFYFEVPPREEFWSLPTR